MPLQVRKLVHHLDETWVEGGKEAAKAHQLAGVAAVVLNPWTGRGFVDDLEVNEAFASQALASLRALGVFDDDPRVNPNGGAIALSHPLGMSGARTTGTAALELAETEGKLAAAAMCIGVGQGIAVALARV